MECEWKLMLFITNEVSEFHKIKTKPTWETAN